MGVGLGGSGWDFIRPYQMDYCVSPKPFYTTTVSPFSSDTPPRLCLSSTVTRGRTSGAGEGGFLVTHSLQRSRFTSAGGCFWTLHGSVMYTQA